MRGHSPQRNETGLTGPVVVSVGLLLMVAAPVIRGGNRHVALIMLEAVALVLLPLLVWQLSSPSVLSRRRFRAVVVLALAPVWVGLIQLAPLPPGLWSVLPGRSVYLQSLDAIQMPVGLWRPVSLMPDATALSVLAGLPIAAAFLMAWLLSSPQLWLMIRVVVIGAFLQAFAGLLQVALLRELYFGAMAYGRAIGSFANPNHFASYLAMSLPLVILLFRRALAGEADTTGGMSRRRRSGVRGTLTSASQPVMAAWWGSVLFFILAALLASLSRAGLAAGLVAGLAAAVLLPISELSDREKRWRLAGVTLAAVAVTASVGIDGLLQRIAGSGSGTDGATRWQLFKATWEAARAFFPFGSGLGSYAGVFPQFQPLEISGFAEYAHSDFIQLLMECGLLFLGLAALAVWLIVRQTRDITQRWQQHPGEPDLLLQISCGFGLLAVFLHSWLDFNLRIPANAMLAAFLFGAFLRPVKLRAGADPQRTTSPA